MLLLVIQEFDFLVDSEPDGISCSLLTLRFLSVNLDVDVIRFYLFHFAYFVKQNMQSETTYIWKVHINIMVCGSIYKNILTNK